MAYDTIVLISPFIEKEVAEKILNCCIKRQGLDLSSGEILYSITTGQLVGSYDHRISIQVLDYVWLKRSDSRVPIKMPSQYYIRIEGSVHKALMGHNVYGGCDNFKYCCRYLVKLCENLIGCKFPDWQNFMVERVDIANIFNLGSFKSVQAYIRQIQNSYFPRRNDNISKHGTNSLYVNGTTTTIKFYHKGPEFKKHDYKRLLMFMNVNAVKNIYEIANNILRVEVEVKKRKLQDMFNNLSVININDDDLNELFDLEVGKMIRVCKENELPLVRNAEDVRERLYNIYSDKQAKALFGTWFEFTTFGEKTARQKLSDRTFYDHRKKLVDAGITWIGTDIIKLDENEMLFPADFVPFFNDIRNMTINCTGMYNKLLNVA